MTTNCTSCGEQSTTSPCARCEHAHQLVEVAIVSRIEALYCAAKRLRKLAQVAHIERAKAKPFGLQLNRTCACGIGDAIYADDLCREAGEAWRSASRLQGESIRAVKR